MCCGMAAMHFFGGVWRGGVGYWQRVVDICGALSRPVAMAVVNLANIFAVTRSSSPGLQTRSLSLLCPEMPGTELIQTKHVFYPGLVLQPSYPTNCLEQPIEEVADTIQADTIHCLAPGHWQFGKPLPPGCCAAAGQVCWPNLVASWKITMI